MAADELTVLFRDEHWLAVFKPTGIPTTAPPTAGVRSLVDRVRSELAPDATHVHPLSRLDVPVTGVVLFALTSYAVDDAQSARHGGAYERRYIALLSREPAPPDGSWEWPVGIDPRDPKHRVAGGGRDPQPARTDYHVARRTPVCGIAWVAMDLRSGRTHQIRVHAQKARCPVLGDKAYGGPLHVTLDDGSVVGARRVMLHAHRVVIPGTRTAVIAEAPADYLSVWTACGGGAE